MKTSTTFLTMRRFILAAILTLNVLLPALVPSARAGLTVDVHLYHDNFGYYFYPNLSANSDLPGFPDGNYEIASPQIPTGGSQLQYQATNGTLSGLGGGGNYYGDFDSFLYGITNGQWSITVTNNTSTNIYFFTVQVTGVTSNLFGPPAQAVYPTSGQINVPNQPLMQWTGPSWTGTLNVEDDSMDSNGNSSYVTGQSLSPDATSWTPGLVLPDGTNQFSVTYQTNVTALITASQPTNSSGQPISAWTSTATLEAHFAYVNSYNVTFTVGSSPNQGNLVVNGGFETGDFTGWTVTGEGNDVDDGSQSGTTPHSGNYEAEFGAGGEIDYISQTLNTTPGASYLLSFWLNSPDGDTPNEFEVSWNGTTLFDQTDLPAFGWTNIQFVVTATGTSTVLQFGGQDDPSYLALDDVSVVPTAGGSSGPVVHYDFDEGTVLAPDVSGNNNNMVYAGNFGGSGPAISSDAEAGAGAVSFDGGSYLTASSNLLATLAGDFTVSLWLNTSQSYGSQGDLAWQGAGIVCADSPNPSARDLIPVALTGGQVAFNVGDGSGNDNTLNSSATVNDGNWHHVVVTRSQATGQRQIFIDGAPDSSDTAVTGLLNDPVLLTIGAISDASNPDPTSPSNLGYDGYQGLLDDIQIYNRVLSSDEVTFLYDNPGSAIAGGNNFNTALNTTNLTWTTGGDLPWFTQTSVTEDGLAAQSGAITNNQSSYLETTVPTAGDVSFYWKVSSEQDYDNLTFYINGNEQDSISGDEDWSQEHYVVSAGDVLRWEYAKDGSDSDGLDAGFLDEVSYVPDTNTMPVITFNPFSQTNYPGYNVSLYAAATSNPTATWQWFKVGSGAISGATSGLYIPTNSGTAGVAGSYFAVASNVAGSANTTTATVTFVSAPLPPDWAIAYKNAVGNNPSDSTTNYTIAMLLDATGTNIYTVGSFTGTNSFGPDTLINAFGTNGSTGSSFLKQTTAGTAIWGRAITNIGTGSSYAQCVVAAPGGGIYAAGDFFGTNWLGTNLLVGVAGGSTFLTRFDADGNVLWVQTFTGTNGNFTEYHDLASDPAGNVTISALISGGTRVATTNVFVNGQAGLIAQFDANGNLRWLQLPSGWPSSLSYNGGAIYGTMGGNTPNYIGGVTNVSDRRQTLFSLNATNGQGNWLSGFAAPKDQGNPYGFADDGGVVAVSGTNIFVAGMAWGSNAAFGPFSVSFPTSKGCYLARYDTNGNPQLATTFGSEFTWVWSIKADASGNVYLGCDFDTYAIFGNDILAAPFYDTVQSLGSFAPGAYIPGQTCVAKFDRNGNALWARLAESQSSFLNSRDIALASDGVWSCGFFNQQSVFGTITINGATTLEGSPIGTVVYHPAGYLAKITDGAAVALPVTLLNPLNSGANFQFSFLSESGFNHNILYRTNLTVGTWLTNSTVTGDGTVKIVSIPYSLFTPSKQGFIRVSTQ